MSSEHDEQGSRSGGCEDCPFAKSDRTVPRRTFFDWLFGTSIGGLVVAVLYPVVRFIIPPERAEAAVSATTLAIDPDDVAPDSGRIFKFGDEPGILIRTPGGELRAFSAICTHLACTVQYRDDLSHIWCACHNGHFDLMGRNIAGPPPSPLEEYDVGVTGSGIVIRRRA